MKKRVLLILISLLLIASPLFSRPQFFLGGGVEWGKLNLGEKEKVILSNNDRFKASSSISHFVPTIETTFIPVADIGLGISGSFGYGGVLGYNDGNDNVVETNNGLLLFLEDRIIDASIGIRYMTVMAKERYLSFSSYALYNYRNYRLLKNSSELVYGKKDKGDYTSLSQHSISLGLGLMERYDAYYFKLDFGVEKPLDFSNGFESVKTSGWRASVSATFGVVFTILNENEFMR